MHIAPPSCVLYAVRAYRTPHHACCMLYVHVTPPSCVVCCTCMSHPHHALYAVRACHASIMRCMLYVHITPPSCVVCCTCMSHPHHALYAVRACHAFIMRCMLYVHVTRPSRVWGWPVISHLELFKKHNAGSRNASVKFSFLQKPILTLNWVLRFRLTFLSFEHSPYKVFYLYKLCFSVYKTLTN